MKLLYLKYTHDFYSSKEGESFKYEIWHTLSHNIPTEAVNEFDNKTRHKRAFGNSKRI